MIDDWRREYERWNTDWPTLAKMCTEVKVKKLWKLGGYKDRSPWVQDAAPVCAKTVFVYVSMYENPTPDFNHEEMREMPPETAKKMTQVSSPCRQDSVIREASKKKRKEFVQTVKAVAPEQHIEDDIRKTSRFSESQWTVIEQTFIDFRGYEEAPGRTRRSLRPCASTGNRGLVREEQENQNR